MIFLRKLATVGVTSAFRDRSRRSARGAHFLLVRIR